MKVWIIWASNEEASEVIGIYSSKSNALKAIQDDADITSKNELKGMTEIPIDGYSSFFLVPREINAPAIWFEKDWYVPKKEEDELK